MRPAELNQLKAMVTMPHVNERGLRAQWHRHPHIASFCGTGNNVVPDRPDRQPPLVAEAVILGPASACHPYELVYSQAYALWKAVFGHWLPQEEIRKLNRITAAGSPQPRRRPDPYPFPQTV